MTGLTWDSIKLEETYPDCQQNFGIQESDTCMEGGSPKAAHSYRTIPLTDKA